MGILKLLFQIYLFTFQLLSAAEGGTPGEGSCTKNLLLGEYLSTYNL